MKTISINLNSYSKTKNFISSVSKFDEDIDLISGRYVIDAKSVMGLFTLDLSKDIIVKIHTSDTDIISRFEKEMENYIVKED